MSVRECARLQTFPDDFVFTGALNSMYRQIGNAVPVLLGKRIGEEIFNSLKSHELEESKTEANRVIREEVLK